jgi:hypothetical protein
LTKLVILLFAIFTTTCHYGYSIDTVKYKKIKVLPVPAFGYSPETRSYIGAVSLFTIRLYDTAHTRISNAKVEFNYTWNKQIIAEAEWNYFFNKEKWFTKERIHFSEYPDFYYGIGGNTPDSNKAIFNSTRNIFEASALKKIGNKLFMGLNIRYINYRNIYYINSSIAYPELIQSKTWGIGYSVLNDSRNSLLTPQYGRYIFTDISYNTSTSNYCKIVADYRQYKTWNNKQTFAVRSYNELNIGSPSFYDLSHLGGDKYVRGYYYGRYRDNCMSTIQAEYRSPFIWRFGAAALCGISAMYPTINTINQASLKYNYGLGLRFLVDKKDNTNLRIDYAIGNNNNSGFYISFGEAF